MSFSHAHVSILEARAQNLDALVPIQDVSDAMSE